jgi:hypothetical protein
VRLERHVGGLSVARKTSYLHARGWREEEGSWVSSIPHTEPLPISRAVHHQLTADLGRALGVWGWKIIGYSPRGYARMQDPLGLGSCSLPAALRRQARREGRPVAELTYSLFLAALL